MDHLERRLSGLMHDAASKRRLTPPRLIAYESSEGIAQIPASKLTGDFPMGRIPGLALLFLLSFLLSAVALLAAENSQTFYLSSDVRAGNVQLPRGICEVTWSTRSGSQVQLTIKSEDKKTVTVPARMVEGKQDRSGTVTSVVNGVTYLNELRTRNAKFILERGTEAAR